MRNAKEQSVTEQKSEYIGIQHGTMERLADAEKEIRALKAIVGTLVRTVDRLVDRAGLPYSNHPSPENYRP